jgi:hypothetical protein
MIMQARILVALLALAVTVGACSKDETVVSPTGTDSQTIGDKDTLSGTVKGTLKAGKTYYMTTDVKVNAGDTLTAEPGSTVIDLGNHTLFIRGAIFINGTKDQMVNFGPDAARQTPGAWGGIECDSPSVASFKYCRVLYGCGIRPDGRPRPSVYFLSNSQNTSTFIMEDCEVSYTKDDGVQLTGGVGHIFRSVFRMNGVVEGSGVNFKSGFTGDVAYNYVWSSNDHAIRAITSATVLFPQTNVNIYNNTIVNYGGKNPSRPGAGVLIDQNTRANVYNNIFVNGRIGLRVTSAADVQNTHYGNNLFYTTVDSLQDYFYPSDGVGQAQTSDLIQVDPKFVNFDPNIDATSDQNDVHLQAGSPAIGKGNPTYDPDLGAYTAKR